uniref:clp protease proteolytic subunit n=1 Tax=Euphorbia hirta TaxID=318062 RepID=UPI001BEEE33B|nr:clp protease proteolytic subunit [Euphorbia hirta]QUV73612.1 clp protease proteolytic subunit [Euphorbia hirta]
MPVGIPKIASLFLGDEDEDITWVDLYSGLYRHRFLFLTQGLDSDVSNQLNGIMIYLNMEDPTHELNLFINSPGGWILPGLALYDTMQFVSPDVQTIDIGVAASMASLILLGGTLTKRSAFPHAWVMIHQPNVDLHSSKIVDFFLEAGEILRARETVTSIYAKITGKPLEVITQDMERDFYMSATEAQAHGIVDRLSDSLSFRPSNSLAPVPNLRPEKVSHFFRRDFKI